MILSFQVEMEWGRSDQLNGYNVSFQIKYMNFFQTNPVSKRSKVWSIMNFKYAETFTFNISIKKYRY